MKSAGVRTRRRPSNVASRARNGTDRTVEPYPAWLAPTTLSLSLGGLAVSVYLTVAHFTSSRILACGSHGFVSCDQVTTSAQSRLLGVPVAILGVAWFLAMAALTTPGAWRGRSRTIGRIRVAAAAAGMAFVLYLLDAELLTIGKLCVWCTVAHVLAFALFALIVLYPRPGDGWADSG